ncbi:MAG: hypothetical protein AAF639_22640 [Chloroflexota bacterium]
MSVTASNQLMMIALWTLALGVSLLAIQGNVLCMIQRIRFDNLCLALMVVLLLPAAFVGAIFQLELLLMMVLIGGLVGFGAFMLTSLES